MSAGGSSRKILKRADSNKDFPILHERVLEKFSELIVFNSICEMMRIEKINLENILIGVARRVDGKFSIIINFQKALDNGSLTELRCFDFINNIKAVFYATGREFLEMKDVFAESIEFQQNYQYRSEFFTGGDGEVPEFKEEVRAYGDVFAPRLDEQLSLLPETVTYATVYDLLRFTGNVEFLRDELELDEEGTRGSGGAISTLHDPEVVEEKDGEGSGGGEEERRIPEEDLIERDGELRLTRASRSHAEPDDPVEEEEKEDDSLYIVDEEEDEGNGDGDEEDGQDDFNPVQYGVRHDEDAAASSAAATAGLMPPFSPLFE